MITFRLAVLPVFCVLCLFGTFYVLQLLRWDVWPWWRRRRAGTPPVPARHAAEEPGGLPARSYCAELTGWQRRMAADLTAARDRVPEGARKNGRTLADELRLGVPGAPDLLLAAGLLTVLNAATCWHDEPALEDMDLFVVMTDAMGMAAVDLTALERV